MKQLIFIILSIFLLPSCATIINKPLKEIRIYTTESSKVVLNSDTFKTVNNKVKVSLLRSKYPINITVLTDSLKKDVIIKPFSSFFYYLNIVENFGIGMLVDRKNPKRYTYPNRVYLNSGDTLNKYFRYSQSDNTGDVCLNFSFPHINTFKLKPIGEALKENTGFWGFSMGIDYYYAKNRFLNVSGSTVMDFFVPVPAAVDIFGAYELMSSNYLSLSNNHQIKRFSLGYGISYSKNTWDFNNYDSLVIKPRIIKSNNALGFIFKSYYQTGTNAYIGWIYRPTFIRFIKQDMFQYEHLMSIDFLWQIRAKRTKKAKILRGI